MSMPARAVRLSSVWGNSGRRSHSARTVCVQCEGKAADTNATDGLTDEQRAQMETAMADPEVRPGVLGTVCDTARHSERYPGTYKSP